MKKTTHITLSIILIVVCIVCYCNHPSKKDNLLKNTFIPKLDTEKEVFLNIIGEYANFEALEQVIMDFNKYYPNVAVSYEMLTDADSTIEKRCATGDMVDVIFIRKLDFETHYSHSLNYLVDLNTIDIDCSFINPDILAAGKYQGKQLLFPVYMMTGGFLVNESLLAHFGYSVPQTSNDFLNICKELSEQGIAPILAQEYLTQSFMYYNSLNKLMGLDDRDAILSDLNQGLDSYNLAKSELINYQTIINEGWFHPDSNDLPDEYNSVILRFLEGDIPFAIVTTDTVSGIPKRESRSIAFTKNPFTYSFISPQKDNSKIFFNISHFFGVYNQSKNQDYANEFMRFLTSEPELQTLADCKNIPGVTLKSNYDALSSLLAQESDRYVFSGSCGISRIALDHYRSHIQIEFEK